jgi:hypothetical protein
MDYQNRAVTLLQRGLASGAISMDELGSDEQLKDLQENPQFRELLETVSRK